MVPNIISTKDLSYLSDIYGWNFNATKHINQSEKLIKNEKVKVIFQQASQMHKENCQKIINILGGNHE